MSRSNLIKVNPIRPAWVAAWLPRSLPASQNSPFHHSTRPCFDPRHRHPLPRPLPTPTSSARARRLRLRPAGGFERHTYVDLLQDTVVQVSSFETKTAAGPLPETGLWLWLDKTAAFDNAEDSGYYNGTLRILEHARGPGPGPPTACTTHHAPAFHGPKTAGGPSPPPRPIMNILNKCSIRPYAWPCRILAVFKQGGKGDFFAICKKIGNFCASCDWLTPRYDVAYEHVHNYYKISIEITLFCN